MRIFFALFFGLSLFIAFSGESEKPKGILDTVLGDMPAGEFPPAQIPVRHVTEFSKDKFGQIIETRKAFSETDVLMEELSYKDGKKFGPHKFFRDGKLSKSFWYFDEKGRRAIIISYNPSGNVINASCTSNIFFTEEHEKVCGFSAPFIYSTNSSIRGKLEVTLDKGIEVAKKHYFRKGGIWIDEKYADEKNYRDTYDEKGILRSAHVSEKNGWSEKRYNREGILLEKQIGIRNQGPYREEAIVYDLVGKEVALWNIVKEGFSVKGCSLKRSLASEAPRPSICP